jgi:hypothetical protein
MKWNKFKFSGGMIEDWPETPGMAAFSARRFPALVLAERLTKVCVEAGG